jgi:DNA gyrase/topoisomerase IV subunit A
VKPVARITGRTRLISPAMSAFDRCRSRALGRGLTRSARNRHHARVDIDDVMRRERLEILEAILAAIDRRSEVSDVVASSETAADALVRLRQLLGISQVGAMEILNMQWRRLARAERRDIQGRIVELRGGA